MYKILYSKDAQKDAKKISKSNIKDKIIKLIQLIENDPFVNPPPFKKLQGKFHGMISRRINLQHRLFYIVEEDKKVIKILRMWSHYGDN